MFRILLKKQMTEIFRAYFYDAKKNKKRSVFSTVLFFGFFIILMVGIVGGMFFYLADSLCKPFAMVNMKWLYFLIMGMIAIALGTFGSVFNTYSGLYLSKDNDSYPEYSDNKACQRVLNGTHVFGNCDAAGSYCLLD